MNGFSDTARINTDSRTVYGVALLRRHSSNGRRYTDRALADLERLAEGRKSYVNHDIKSDGRDIRDLVGYFSGVKSDGDLVTANLHYLPQWGDLLEAIVTDNPNLAGFSIHAYTSTFNKNGDGVQIVDDLSSLESVDLVTEPAATTGMFESGGKRKMKDTDFDQKIESACGLFPVREDREQWEQDMEKAILGYVPASEKTDPAADNFDAIMESAVR